VLYLQPMPRQDQPMQALQQVATQRVLALLHQPPVEANK
jgi:hypothetical protein